MKGHLNTISLRKNSQDSLLFSDPTRLPAEYWRVSLSMSAAEWNDGVQYLPIILFACDSGTRMR